MNDSPPAGEAPSTDPVYLLGVDGGGSKTVAWLACLVDGTPQVVGKGESGTSNVRAAGADRALANLNASIEAARHEAHWSGSIATAVLGLAGSANHEVRATVESWCASQNLARRSMVVHDARPVIAAGTPDDWGVALIAGTGSVVYAKSEQGDQTAVAGGWGYLFGDEGSGFWIGREALRRMGRAVDGRALATPLTAVLLEALQVDDPREVLSALNARGDLREATAALAPHVLSLAGQGDGDAQQIVRSAAEELADLVAAAARAIVAPMQYPLAIAGGVLVGNAQLRDLVLATLEANGHAPGKVEIVEQPVAGCIRMASDLLT